MTLIVWRYKETDQWYLYHNGEAGLASEAQREIPVFVDSVDDKIKALAAENEAMYKAGQSARKEYRPVGFKMSGHSADIFIAKGK